MRHQYRQSEIATLHGFPSAGIDKVPTRPPALISIAPQYQLEIGASKQAIFPPSSADYTVFGSLYIPKMVLLAKRGEKYLTSCDGGCVLSKHVGVISRPNTRFAET